MGQSNSSHVCAPDHPGLPARFRPSKTMQSRRQSRTMIPIRILPWSCYCTDCMLVPVSDDEDMSGVGQQSSYNLCCTEHTSFGNQFNYSQAAPARPLRLQQPPIRIPPKSLAVSTDLNGNTINIDDDKIETQTQASPMCSSTESESASMTINDPKLTKKLEVPHLAKTTQRKIKKPRSVTI